MTQTMTEDEARAILSEVEPPHAAAERDLSRTLRSDDPQTLRPFVDNRGTGVAYEEWRPRATRTPSGWAIEGGWLDEPVPPLPTTIAPSCAVRPVQLDASDSLWERYGTRVRVMWSNMATTIGVGSLIGETIGPLMRHGVDHLPLDAVRESESEWHSVRRWYRYRPILAYGRGWCAALSGESDAAARGLAKEWPAMERSLQAEMRRTDAAWTAERAELTQRTRAA